MGNRAVITTEDMKIGVYLHWNGGRDSVEAFLKYCEMKQYRPPSDDGFGWARLCQVIGNFFGGTECIGIDLFSRLGDQGDNDVYIIEGWKIERHIEEELGDDWEATGRWVDFPESKEQRMYDLDGMLYAIDEAMPYDERLGDYLDAEEVPVPSLEVGDMVYMDKIGGGYETYPVVGFGEDGVLNGIDVKGMPYVRLYNNDGRYDLNINNYVRGETCKIEPRASAEDMEQIPGMATC